MQKVVGSSPISRLREARSWSGFFVFSGRSRVSAETLLGASGLREVDPNDQAARVAVPGRASEWRGTVIPVSGKSDAVRRQASFSKLERVKREEAKRRFRETTAGERVESALRLSELATELRSGLRARGE